MIHDIKSVQRNALIADAKYLDDLKEIDPDLADELISLRTSNANIDRSSKPEDRLADDYGWLYSFEYEGKLLTGKEICAVMYFLARRGDTTRRAIDARNPIGMLWATPQVQAALRHATRTARVRYEVNTNKVIRELSAMLDARITDFVDASPAGIVVKDLSQVPQHLHSAIAEIHEVRNAQGVQIKVKLYDKMQAIGIAARLLDMNPADRMEVKVSGLSDRLNSALARLKDESNDVIEGELAP